MAARLHRLLDDYLDAYLAAGGVVKLNPPVTNDEIAEAEEILGFEIPDWACELWRWRNGQRPVSGHSEFFLQANLFRDLSKSAELFRHFVDPATTARYESPEGMEPVPGLVFADGGQFSMAVVSFREADLGSVWGWEYFGVGDEGIARVFDSIEDFVECHLRILQTGAVERNEYEPGRVTLNVPIGDARVAALNVPPAWQQMAGF